MTKQEFIKTHREFLPADLFTTNDMLMRVAANLSDLHIEKSFFTPEQMDQKLDSIKEYIFDYMDVLRNEEKNVPKDMPGFEGTTEALNNLSIFR